MTEEMRNGGYPEGTEKQSRHSSLAAKLVICVGKAQLQAVPVTDDIILGQEQKDGYLGIPSGNVMPDHGRLVRQENGFAYEDLQGKGCTYLNDLLVSPENFPGMKQIPLSDGDVLRFETSGGTFGPEERTVLLYRSATWRTHSGENLSWIRIQAGIISAAMRRRPDRRRRSGRSL